MLKSLFRQGHLYPRINIDRKIVMIARYVIRRKPEALIKRETGHSPVHFSIRRINALDSRAITRDFIVREYRPFQAMPIFSTKLLGYSTLVGFMVLT